MKYLYIILLTMLQIDISNARNIDNIYYLTLGEKGWAVSLYRKHGAHSKIIFNELSQKLRLFSAVADKYIVILGEDGSIYRVNATTSHHSRFDLPINGITDATLSPNGTIAYSSSIAGSIDAHDIWSYDPNTGKITQLTRMAKMQHQPSWCDDRQLVFVSSTSEQSHDLWRLDVPTNSLHQLTAGQLYNFEPSCSVANGIVFSSNRSGDYEIWSTDLDGKHFTQLTSSPGLDGQPAWSPDGSQIAFISNRTGYPAVWVMNRDGSNQHQVSPEGMICRNPVWGISEQ